MCSGWERSDGSCEWSITPRTGLLHQTPIGFVDAEQRADSIDGLAHRGTSPISQTRTRWGAKVIKPSLLRLTNMVDPCTVPISALGPCQHLLLPVPRSQRLLRLACCSRAISSDEAAQRQAVASTEPHSSSGSVKASTRYAFNIAPKFTKENPAW